MNAPPALNGINGSTSKVKVNGVNGIVGKGKPSAGIPPPLGRDEYDVPPNGGYLEGYTMEDIISARQISDPHMFFTLPPFAQKNPVRLDSFRTGHKPTVEELRSELPVTFEGQTPLAEIIDRVIQHAYENLTEMAEVMPSFSDKERKEKIIEWAVATRKVIIKVYAIANWARVSDEVQKAMDVHEFLNRCASQISQIPWRLEVDAKGLIMKKRRNADLLNAVDILTTGTYRRLPSILKEVFEDPKTLSDEKVIATLAQIDDAIRYRLRFHDVLPPAMSKYRISDGRAWFSVPNLFEASFSLTGRETSDFWQMLDMKFLFGAETENRETITSFPPDPPPNLKTQILWDVNQLLVLNFSPPAEPGGLPQPIESPDRVDTPFVRAFNTLQMLSLHYQLNILKYQADRLITLGWADFLKVERSTDGLSINVFYWTKTPPKPKPNSQTPQQPPQGGTITISIESNATPESTAQSSSVHVDTLMTQLSRKLKSEATDGALRTPTDTVDRLSLVAKWTPSPYTLGVTLQAEDTHLHLAIDAQNLDFAEMLNKALRKHACSILRSFQHLILYGPRTRKIFSDPEDVELIEDGRTGSELRIHLCGSQSVIVTIDHRSGNIVLRGSGDFAAAGSSWKFEHWSRLSNEDPAAILIHLIQMKYLTILETVQHQASYLGLYSSRSISLLPTELQKFGTGVRMFLFIPLTPYPGYYLAMLGAEEALRWALISTADAPRNTRVIRDVGMLDWPTIGGDCGRRHFQWIEADKGDAMEVEDGGDVQRTARRRDSLLGRQSNGSPDAPDRSFSIKTEVLRELYAFCCARVSHTKVEQQLKLRGIPCTSVFSPPTSQPESSSSTLAPFCPTACSVPMIWIHSKDILQHGATGKDDVAYHNIKIKVIDWWSERPSRVVTSVKLRYVQPLSGLDSSKDRRKSGSSQSLHVVHPSRGITYDPSTSIVSFISESVDTCVGEFLDEWNRVQRVIGIAQEVGKAKLKRPWSDVQILSFDLRKVEFVYQPNHAVSIQWIPGAAMTSSTGSYSFTFRCLPSESEPEPRANPHAELSSFLSKRLQEQAGQSMAAAVGGLLTVLRNTLPVLTELNRIEKADSRSISLLIKSSAWYRLMYGLRYAVDFRSLRDGRVAILDVARSHLLSSRAGRKEPTTTVFDSIDSFDEVAKAVAAEIAKGMPARRSGRPSFPPMVWSEGALLCRGDVIGQATSLLHGRLMERLRDRLGVESD